MSTSNQTTSLPTTKRRILRIRAHSSAGQSSGLLIRRSQVRILLGVLFTRQANDRSRYFGVLRLVGAFLFSDRLFQGLGRMFCRRHCKRKRRRVTALQDLCLANHRNRIARQKNHSLEEPGAAR